MKRKINQNTFDLLIVKILEIAVAHGENQASSILEKATKVMDLTDNEIAFMRSLIDTKVQE